MPISRGSIQDAPLSGVNPRAMKGSQKVAFSAAIVKSAARAIWQPSPAAHPRTLQTIGSWRVVMTSIRRWAWIAVRR